MTLWLWIAAVIVFLLLVLVARGMYLIGQGSKAELQARDQTSGTISSSGWMVLGKLRGAEEIPIVSTIESWLERMNKDEDEQP